MNFTDLDYVLDSRDRFWIIHGLRDKLLYGNLVFVPDARGNRYNRITKKHYKKVILANMQARIIRGIKIKKIFKPRDFFIKNYSKLPGKWKNIPKALMAAGIKKQNIGIFGSYLLGFDVIKDIDFVVYGIDNFKKVKKNILKIRRLVRSRRISREHIEYQYRKYKNFYSLKNSFREILSYNWAGLQIERGVLSTIRFVKEELADELRCGRTRIFRGKVLEKEGTNFMPRIGFVKTKKSIVRVLTYNWMFNNFLKKGDKVLIRGGYCKKNNTLYISNKKHWIKILD
jgi:predicted nucleotidyltransferase